MREAGITHLPEDVLGRILGLAGLPSGPSITLTSRLWRRVFYEQQAVWSSLRVSVPGGKGDPRTKQWLRGTLALLRRVGPLVRDAEVSGASLLALGGLAGAGATALSQLLRCLDGTALASLALLQQKLLTDDCSALARLTSLRRLHVVFEGPVRQPLPALPLLEQLAVQAPALRSLDQLGWQLAAQPSAGAVLPPQQLTSLTLRSSCDALPPLQPLTALTQLHELEVVEEAADWEQEGLPLLATTAFPSLQRVAFTSHRGLRVGGGAVVRCIYAAHAPATVQLRRDPACASAWLLACADLLLAHHTASLDALLAALGVAPTQLSRVLLQQCVVVPSGVPAAPLPGVTRLILQQLGAGAARDLAPRLPQLAVANLLEMGLEGADALAPLAGLATLHTLQCDGCDLRELPEGRYLAGLTALQLSGARFECLPRALAGATRLESLSLEGCSSLHLTAADVDAVLARMPALRVLRLTQGCSEVTAAAAARIARTLPRLDAQLVPSQPAQHEQQHEQPQLTP